MSVKLMAKVWELEIPQTEKIILLALADHANDDGVCWPSVPMIAKKCSVSERSVYRTLKSLADSGFVDSVKNIGKQSVYKINLDNYCQNPTPDRVSPVPLTECHPTPDRVSGVSIYNDVNHHITTSKPSYVCAEPEPAQRTPRKKSAQTDVDSTVEKPADAIGAPPPVAYKTKAIVPSKTKIHLNPNTGQFENVTDEQISRWAEAYPAIDVATEVNRAAAWIMANPKNKKSNYERFLVNWLSRSQDKAPRLSQPPNKPQAFMDTSKKDFSGPVVRPM